MTWEQARRSGFGMSDHLLVHPLENIKVTMTEVDALGNQIRKLDFELREEKARNDFLARNMSDLQQRLQTFEDFSVRDFRERLEKLESRLQLQEQLMHAGAGGW